MDPRRAAIERRLESATSADEVILLVRAALLEAASAGLHGFDRPQQTIQTREDIEHWSARLDQGHARRGERLERNAMRRLFALARNRLDEIGPRRDRA